MTANKIVVIAIPVNDTETAHAMSTPILYVYTHHFSKGFNIITLVQVSFPMLSYLLGLRIITKNSL